MQGGDDTNASFYAGLLVSAFAVAEAASAMVWGTISDRYGRKPIILIGLAGNALSSLLFGFAQNFWVALAARLMGGLLNGNVAVMQTMVAEMVTNPKHERTLSNQVFGFYRLLTFRTAKAYAVQPFMWNLGSIVGFAMGGFLAQPARYYPKYFAADGLFGKFPYLLPNLVAVGVILVAIIQGYFLLQETNPRFLSREEDDDETVIVDESTPLQRGARRKSAVDFISTGRRRPSFVAGAMPTTTEPTFDLRKSSIATIRPTKSSVSQIERISEHHDEAEHAPKAFTHEVIMWTVALVLMCYHSMAFMSILPIYLLDEPEKSSGLDLKGGLGYTVHDSGVFLSVNGLSALFIQALIFPVFVGTFGVWKSVISLTILCPLVYVIMPFLSLLPHPGLRAGIYAICAVQNFFTIIIYPGLLILLKNATTSPLVLGKVNGLAMSASSGARTVAPPLVGIIYSAGGSAAAWWSCAAFAAVAIVQLYWVKRPEVHETVDFEGDGRRGSTVPA